MNSLFALVLTVAMTNGDFQDVILGVYDNQQDARPQLSSKRLMVSAGLLRESFATESCQQASEEEECRKNAVTAANPLKKAKK